MLAALGLKPAQFRSVFVLYGGCPRGGGRFSESRWAVAIAWVLTEFELIRFDPELAAIYFISSVPFRVELGDVLAVLGFTLLVTLVSCWLPAQRAASIRPARALRYE